MTQFGDYYIRRFREIFGQPPKPEEGIESATLRASLEAKNLSIPLALFDYYSTAGQHWINRTHNQLRPIKEFSWVDDKLVFMDENQDVVCWGIDRADLGLDDPIVWQGVAGDPIKWYQEDHTASRFLMAMWAWTHTGEMPTDNL